jgi:hypothetical protein
MLQRSGGDGFGAEAFHRLRRRVWPEQELLESDHPIQAFLAGLIDHAHAAVPNLLQQLVLSEIAGLREARGRGESGRALMRVVWVPERRLHGMVKAQTVEAPGTEPFRGVGREFRTTTRTCAGI